MIGVISIIKYGDGNLKLIRNMPLSLGENREIRSGPTKNERAKPLTLPRVGRFGHKIETHQHSGLIDVLNRNIWIDKALIPGICIDIYRTVLISWPNEDVFTEQPYKKIA